MLKNKMSNHRNIIDGNLVQLCQLTRCNEIFIDTCAERYVITHEDKDVIENEEIPYNRSRKFYNIMRLKDDLKLRKLVEIMKEENTAQSDEVLDILEGSQSSQSSQRCPRLQKRERSVWFDVQDPITSFVGRENELKELHKMVIRNADKDTQVAVMSQLTSLSGMGGIGKTTLAREYARRYAYFFNNNIIWINAETTKSTEESFRKLADEIDVHSLVMVMRKVKEIPISKVSINTYEYFSRRKCLFIFDNVEEYKSTVAPFIPKSYQPGKIRPYILMTSRKQRLVDDCRVLRLDVLAIEDAEKFIKSKLQKCMGHIDDDSVRKLANELQCLPLALQQAVAYIQTQVRLKSFFPRKERKYISEYLELLEKNPKEPLNHKYQDETMDDYSYTVMRTWDVTLQAIKREKYGRQAIEILEMLSYFPPDNIDMDHFDRAFSEKELQHCCVILEQYSLINHIPKYINIHRLVQQVIQVQNKEKDREEYILRRCLSLVPKNITWYKVDKQHTYWNIWKHTLRYEKLVIEFRSILENIFTFGSTKDVEILNSCLEILEKTLTQEELLALYAKFVNSAVNKWVLREGIPEWLLQKVVIKLNALVELGHYDSFSRILYNVHTMLHCWVQFDSMAPNRKIIREIMKIISNYCYEHSEEILQRRDLTPYYLVYNWLKLKEQGQCRKCFKLLVLETGAEIVNCTVIGDIRNPVFQNFHLFTKYLLQLGTITDKKEREFVTQVLNFCNSLLLGQVESESLEKVDILLCNILCLLLLNHEFEERILSCVFKISTQMRQKLMEFLVYNEVNKAFEVYYIHYIREAFGRTLNDITFILNRVVMIGTTPLVSLEWTHYVEKIINLIIIYEKILLTDFSKEGSFTPRFSELESASFELEECCKPFLDDTRLENPGRENKH